MSERSLGIWLVCLFVGGSLIGVIAGMRRKNPRLGFLFGSLTGVAIWMVLEIIFYEFS